MDRDLEALIERRVEERMDEEQSHLHQQINALVREKEQLQRERDRALQLAVEAGVTPVLRVNLGNRDKDGNPKPYFLLVRCDTQEEYLIEDPQEAIDKLVAEKRKTIEAGGDIYR